MSRQLKKNSRDNKDIILDRWKEVAPHYWTHQMIATEVGLTEAAIKKTVQRARRAGDSRAVMRPVGKSPW